MKQLGLATHMYGSARRDTFPAANDRVYANGTGVAGKIGTSAQSGYSWIVMTLPYAEETALYDRIKTAATGAAGSFSILPMALSSGTFFSNIQLPGTICPSWAATLSWAVTTTSAPRATRRMLGEAFALEPRVRGRQARQRPLVRGRPRMGTFRSAPPAARQIRPRRTADGALSAVTAHQRRFSIGNQRRAGIQSPSPPVHLLPALITAPGRSDSSRGSSPPDQPQPSSARIFRTHTVDRITA